MSDFASASDLAREVVSHHRSLQTSQHLQNLQFEKLNKQMDEIWRLSRDLEALPKDQHYTPKSANLYQKLGELERGVRETSSVFYNENMRVRMNATVAEDVVALRRTEYLKRIDNLASMDRKGLSSLNLPKEILQDIEVRRALSGLDPTAKHQLWNQFEGRKFGQAVPLHDEKRMLEMVKGVRTTGTVSVDTYHASRSVQLRAGEFIRLQTPTGAIVQGSVMGILPDGRVLLENFYGNALKDSVPGLNGARVIDLNQARQINVYADKHRLAMGQPDVELSVRLSQKEILAAIKSQSIATIARRKPVNGSYEDRARVNATVIDKRAGEQLGTAVREGFGAIMGLGF